MGMGKKRVSRELWGMFRQYQVILFARTYAIQRTVMETRVKELG